MKQSTPPFYQGRDWVSSRWAIAETFDTLERIHDLCLCRDVSQSADTSEETFAILQAIHGLVETLSGQCANAMADVIPTKTPVGAFEQLWLCQEIGQELLEMKQSILELSIEDSGQAFSEIALLALSLKSAFKKLDQ